MKKKIHVLKEIRTPLSGVTGAITLLKDTNLNQEQFEYLHISEVCCGQLMAIINDILDFTKMETENMVQKKNWREK